MPTKAESPPVKNRDAKELEFQGLNGKKVSIVFDEPELTSDAGLLAIGEFEKSLGWIEKLAGCISDGRVDPTHGMKELLTQRIYQIMGGYPDANDCDRMRSDGTLQTISGVEQPLASQPTMSRLENTVKAIDLNPGSVRALTGAAIAFLESGNPEGALSPLNQSTTFQPEISVIYYLRAAVNSELGEQWRFKGSFCGGPATRATDLTRSGIL